MDNLYAEPAVVKWIKENIADWKVGLLVLLVEELMESMLLSLKKDAKTFKKILHQLS